MNFTYIIIIGSEDPAKASILKCEKTGENFTFNSTEEALDCVNDMKLKKDTHARVVCL